MRRGHLTFMMVPEDERDVRRIRVSYRALRWGGAAVGTLGVALLLALGSYGSLLSRATRAALLERENRRLTAENAKVDEIAENLERSERTYRQIRSLAGLGDLPASVDAAVLPVEEEPALEPTRESPGAPGGGAPPEPVGWPLQVRGFMTARFEGPDGHSGVDIAVPPETPVLATAAGVVVEAGFDSVLGHHVVLAHTGELETAYAHNVRLLVEPGQRVARGEAIAESGSTGRSSAPHLHYEVRRAGRPIDPEPYLR
ncbi:MAG TPA: M23 family metallopeptidase [Gemmatimonadota bacterium]|nr:M23 family metallopeptidase [Gemmatimonadota bacterium]